MRRELRKVLREKMREAAASVLPVSMLVFLISLTPLVKLQAREIAVFLISAAFLMIGIALFNLGADLAMTPMGQHMGEGLTKSKRLPVLLGSALVMGILITVAEPDLSVLAGQVAAVIDQGLLIGTVGAGVGILLLIAVLKIVQHKDLNSLLIFFYFLMFAFASLLITQGKEAFLPMSFDAGGVTTGPITVPFIMALGVGIALTVGGRGANENSFGLVALCSAGPILSVLLLSMLATGSLSYTVPDYSVDSHLGPHLLPLVGEMMLEVARSLLLLCIFFAILQKLVLKLPKARLVQIAVGLLYTFLGLVIFLTSVTVGFMPVGYRSQA